MVLDTNNNDKTKNVSLIYYENVLYFYHFKLQWNPVYLRHKLLPLEGLQAAAITTCVAFSLKILISKAWQQFVSVNFK